MPPNQEKQSWEDFKTFTLALPIGAITPKANEQIKDFIRTQRQEAVASFVERVKAKLTDGEALLSVDAILDQEAKQFE